jgi:hypothetical protein
VGEIRENDDAKDSVYSRLRSRGPTTSALRDVTPGIRMPYESMSVRNR